jgi:hypothetical protein
MAHHELSEKLDEWAKLEQLPPSDGADCRCGVTKPTCCATYVGPMYSAASVPILFVGLDGGQPWDAEHHFFDAKTVQDSILRGYTHEKRGWNPHYKGCVRVAAEILGLACKSDCPQRCAGNEGTTCALNCFAQGNAVRCVRLDSKGMTFESQARVQKCLPFLFQQFGILKPKVIVLQGRNVGNGLIHDSFKRELQEGKWGKLLGEESNCVQLIEWHRYSEFSGPTILASLRHPAARGRQSLLKSWRSHFAPAIEVIREFLLRVS